MNRPRLLSLILLPKIFAAKRAMENCHINCYFVWDNAHSGRDCCHLLFIIFIFFLLLLPIRFASKLCQHEYRDDNSFRIFLAGGGGGGVALFVDWFFWVWLLLFLFFVCFVFCFVFGEGAIMTKLQYNKFWHVIIFRAKITRFNYMESKEI